MSDTIGDDNLLYSESKEATQPGSNNANTTDGLNSGFAQKRKMSTSGNCKTDDRAGTTETTTSASGAVADGATTATSDNGARIGGSSGTLETNTMASKGEHPIRSIQDHALIGNLKTAALVSLDGSIESMCIPYFDSPSVFARILDAEKGGHFSITPTFNFRTKQMYKPNSNVLTTKFLNDSGIGMVTDFLVPSEASSVMGHGKHIDWLIRKIDVIRGKVPWRVECAPAFNYCRDKHETKIVADDTVLGDHHDEKALFSSPDLCIDLRYYIDTVDEDIPGPAIKLDITDMSERGLLGPAITSEFELDEGQCVIFVLRQYVNQAKNYKSEAHAEAAKPTQEKADRLNVDMDTLLAGVTQLRPDGDPIINRVSDAETVNFWQRWIGKSKYKGRWREAVHRSALTLKMLVFEATGAIVAAPTFSLPEHIGGERNWDYRFTWVRDTAFTLYALIRLGFTEEAEAYMNFILARLKDRNSDGSLQIVYTIHGGKDLPEEELSHLAGHKDSRPVRIGNGAVDHLQLDIYGELMDAIYLAQKWSKPLSWESWIAVRQVVDYVCTVVHKPDLSIWEVRGKEKNFVYSKVMMWVAIDRGLRLAEKRNLPCPNRAKWFQTRDLLYEEIQTKGWNAEKGFYCQSYEDKEVLDSAVLIMPLVFFTSAADPRFESTLKQILKTPERGGLTANNSVFRYDFEKADDGMNSEEGAFSLCTLWAIEALTRVGAYGKPEYLKRAVNMFEDFLGYANHVQLMSEEISRGGEGLGNTPQGFSHVQLISAAYNLDRVIEGNYRP
ncbi:hypothetical protein QFC22_002392 [Naganishia vaughanmartiniae]|uniref:Uncharacterized protein n=1 Tax=Naganishia vaughanmartiniae TaxID=1424756 RepID=A0ACC2XEF6_9TREE|nr:hypothetical protein QFC22_002392 [Naganishia vaughanmartiniae]